MAQEFYLSDGKERKGPFGLEQLKEVGLTPDTLVWAEGFDDWKPARKVERLQHLLRKIPPPIPSAPKRRFHVKAWAVFCIVALAVCTALGVMLYSSSRVHHHLHPAEPEMVFVEGGKFTMGCTAEQGGDCYNSEIPPQVAIVGSFRISKYEVTQAQWKAIMGGSNPSLFKGDSLPVENVSWNDAQEFIRQLNAVTGKSYRLPTEAEWEYAARGGKKGVGYKYSGSNGFDAVSWSDENSGDATHPVGTKQANELGLYDMSGNVWEWCSDRFGKYSTAEQINPTGAETGTYRVLRGGSWGHNEKSSRVAGRYYSTPSHRYGDFGFRIALP